jgi:hypothetical protein
MTVFSSPPDASAVSIPSLEDPAVYHISDSDYRSGDCVLTSCTYMLRRAAIRRKSPLWSSITNAKVRKAATVGGNSSSVKNAFYFNHDGIEYTIGCGQLTGNNADEKKAMLAGLLNKYKYGVVVYGSNAATTGSHGVLAVEVKNSTVYAADAAFNTGDENLGIQKWNSTIMKSISKCTKYWVITKVSGSSNGAEKDNVKSTLRISGVRAPESLKQGKSFTIKGIIESNYPITSVTVKILDKDGSKVISVKDKPDAGWTYDLKRIDPYIKFGTLKAGKYTYIVSAKDQKKSKTLVKAKFKVTADKKSKTGKTNAKTK